MNDKAVIIFLNEDVIVCYTVYEICAPENQGRLNLWEDTFSGICHSSLDCND